MTNPPAGQRTWKCPDCGRELLLSITQLDPMACDACLAKLKGSLEESQVGTAPASILAKPVAVGGIMLVIGLAAGFVLGRLSVPPAPFVRPTRPAESSQTTPDSPKEHEHASTADEPDESTRPGPGYKWVRGYTRKDGVKVKGHWAKDPSYTEPDKKRKK